MAFLALITLQANAQQPAGNYGFTETTEVYTAVVGTNSTATGDDGSQNTIALPFTFKFEGVTYTNFSINTNGFIRLGNTIAASSFSNLLSNTAAQRPLIAPFWDDNNRNTGSIQYAVSGVSPNQILEIGWDNINIGGSGATSTTLFASYKIRLYETTDVIEFIYGSTMANAGTLTASVGINGTATFLSVTPLATSTVSNATANNTIAATTNLVGKKFIFTPPSPPTCPAPTALTATNMTANSADLGWTENGTATLWQIEGGPTGFVLGTGSSGNVPSNPYTSGGLAPATTYDFYVRAICGSGDTSTWAGPFTFTTACPVYIPNYTQPFNTFIPNTCWDEADAGTVATGPSTLGASPWVAGTAIGNTARINLYTNTRSDWVLSPFFDLSLGGYEVVLDVAVTNWNSAVADVMGADDSVRVVYSEDGIIWNNLMTWTVANNLSNALTTFSTLIPSTGNNVQFGILATDGPIDNVEDYDFHIDNFIVRIPPTCNAPSTLTATAVTTTSANLGWTENGTATTWNIEWDTTGFTPGTGNMITGTTTNPHNLTSLTANTAYQFYVQADCGGSGTSTWVGPFSFYTGYCIPSSSSASSYIDNFTTTGGATNISNLASGFTVGGYFDGTTQAVESYPSGTFDFNATIVGGTVGFAIWIDWNNDLIFDNVTEKVYNTTAFGNGPFTSTITVPGATPLGNYRMRINTDWNQSNPSNPCAAASRAEFEDYTVTVSAPPSCTPPSVLTATAITAASANLGWTENGTATTWNIEWDTTGFTPGTGTMVTGTTANPHNITGLAPTTTYQFYVQADCGGSGTSTWAGPFSFTTPCAAVVAPWNENFENAGLIPNCWKQGVGNAEPWRFSNTGAGNHIGNNGTITGTTSSNGYFAWVDDSSPNSLNTTLESPLIDVSALTIPELSFYLISNNEGFTNVSFSVNVWDGATWNVGFYTHNTNTIAGGWEQITVDLSTLTITGPIQLRFIVDETNGTDFYDDVAIDDVDIHQKPACVAPTVLTATTITATSANLGWTENGTATAWNIEWSTTGFTPGTGTMISGTTTNPHNLIGLTAATTYQFYVQADCGGSGTSTWAGPFSFTTPCTTLAVPFLEDFETASPSLPCWSQIQEVGAGNWTFATGAGGGTILAAQSGTNNARFVSQSGVNSPITKLVSPVFDLTTLTTPKLLYYYGQEDWAGDQNQLKIYYRISASDPWVQIAHYTANVAAWTKDSLILPNPSATYQIAFEGINNYGRANVIDDVEIKEGLTPCSIPSNLTAFNITQTSAMLDWTENGTATEWNIEWGFQGFTLGTGTPVHVLSKPYLLNGLMPSTAYDYYVQADCGTDSSAWVGPFTFMTPPCMPIGLELGADTTVCSNQTLTLNAPTGGPYGWSWSTGESTPSITVDTTSLGGNGTYNISVAVIDFSTTCFYNDNINVTFSVCTGVNENVASNFTIYPNPTDGWITVKIAANDKGEIEVTNIQGKVIYKNTLNSNAQNIDLSANAKGVYFVTVTTTNGVEIQKMVIQ